MTTYKLTVSDMGRAELYLGRLDAIYDVRIEIGVNEWMEEIESGNMIRVMYTDESGAERSLPYTMENDVVSFVPSHDAFCMPGIGNLRVFLIEKNGNILHSAENDVVISEPTVTKRSIDGELTGILPIDGDKNSILPHVSVHGRRIDIPADSLEIAVRGDMRAVRVIFDVDRYYDGMDLGSRTFYVELLNANEAYDRMIPSVEIFDEIVQVVWEVQRKHVSVAGEVKVRLRAESPNYIWHTYTGVFTVKDTFEGAEKIPDEGITLFEQAANSAKSAADGAKKSSESAAESESRAKSALEQTKEVRDGAIQEISEKKESAIAHIEAEKDDLAPPVICTKSGKMMTMDDSADRPLRGLTVYGKTTQDGTPGEDAPVEMHSVGDAGEVTVSVLAGLPEGGTDRIAIISQPRDVTAAADSAATFRVFAIGRGLTYQWEYMPTTSTTWRNNTLPGNNTDTLTFSAKAYHDGYKYRCLITDASGNTVRTDEVTLTIGEASGSGDAAADTQTAAISIADGLRGVPVTGSAGTYTDADGQGWIADTIEYDVRTGTAQLVRRVGSVTFDGNAGEEWTLDTQNNPYLVIAIPGKTPGGELCTHYSRAEIEPGTSQTGFSADASGDKIVFRPADFATITVDAWRARLNASPVTVLYALAVPETTPITGDELTAIARLRSRYPETTIYNDAQARMAARYVADTKNYVDRRIEQLTNALVSTGANI